MWKQNNNLQQTRAINFLQILKGNFNDIYIYLTACVGFNNGNKAVGDIKISSIFSFWNIKGEETPFSPQVIWENSCNSSDVQ